MTTNANILVIIVTWNKKEYVIDLLHSLSSLTFPSEQLDIVVVDNASTDGTVTALEEQFKDIKIICNSENLGGTGGFNTGLAWAFAQEADRYDYLWLLDNDVVVHRNALSELVMLLEAHPDMAVAGSTMMQLDFPWRINEMGAFVDKASGSLVFNRHFESIPRWQGLPIADLLQVDADLSQQLICCQASMDVDYVAAASLLVRAPVAKSTGLWMDFFIHFDDVEWCLRIAQSGHRIVVSAKSLIWHVSAITKVPSWILYYDNRNILYLLDRHSSPHAVKNVSRNILKKTLYYELLAKPDLAALHLHAIDDFQAAVMGKKAINLPYKSQAINELKSVFSDPSLHKILIPWTVNCQATAIQTLLVQAMRQRQDLQVFYLAPPAHITGFSQQIPAALPITVSGFTLLRYWQYFRLRHQFDLCLQSDYQPIIPLSWLATQIIFINDENFCLRPPPQLKLLFKQGINLLRRWLTI